MADIGVLHFDVSLGCTAEVVIGALAELVGSVDVVNQGLAACHIKGMSAHIRRQTHKNGAGYAIEFAGDNEPATLFEMAQIIEDSELSPISLALAQKIILLLTKSLSQALLKDASNTPLEGADAARMLCEIVAFSQFMSALNPQGVSASRVSLSTSPNDLNNSAWLLTLIEEVPTLDRPWPAPYADCVGIALIKSVASRFGARGESTLVKHGTGMTASLAAPVLTAKALWCNPQSIATRADETSTFQDRLPVVEVTAIVEHGTETAELMRRLSGIGMTSATSWQVFESSTFPRLMVRGFISDAEMDKAVEALLVSGGATEVITSVVESQRLQSRVVSVPYGRGQKMQSCRVCEWLWSGKVLRADPDPGDLTLIVKSTGFAQEVVRADVLAAWRKWRQAE